MSTQQSLTSNNANTRLRSTRFTLNASTIVIYVKYLPANIQVMWDVYAVSTATLLPTFRRRCYVPSNRRWICASRQGVTSEKTWLFSNDILRTSHLAYLAILLDGHDLLHTRQLTRKRDKSRPLPVLFQVCNAIKTTAVINIARNMLNVQQLELQFDVDWTMVMGEVLVRRRRRKRVYDEWLTKYSKFVIHTAERQEVGSSPPTPSRFFFATSSAGEWVSRKYF